MLDRTQRKLFTLTIISFILFFSCAVTFAQNAPVQHHLNESTKFTIAGTVVNSLTGEPITNARLLLVDTANPATVMTIISSDGHFAFRSLDRGKFSLQAARRGFLPSFYEQHEQYSTAIVTGAGFNTENLVVRMKPVALISGKVIDEAGDPVRNANVTLYGESHQAGMNRIEPRGADSTDDQGYFEFAHLAPANYFLSVTATPWYAIHSFSRRQQGADRAPSRAPEALDVAYPATFNNGATDSQGAAAISVHAGDHTQVDIHLSPVPVLHLIIRVPVSDEQQQNFTMPTFSKRVFDGEEFVQSEGMQPIAPGVFEITGVPAGRYSIRLQSQQSGEFQQSSEMNLSKDGQEVDASQGEPSARVKLSVKMPRQEPLPKQSNAALQNSRQQIVAYQPIGSNGETQFENLPAGKYTLLIFSPDKQYSVMRTVSSGVEIAGHDIDLAPGASSDVTAFLTAGVVNVEGFVKRAGKPSSGVMVALIPKDPQAHLEMFRRDQSDFDGSFVLRGVIPGNYTLVAIEDAWGFAWQKPDILKRYIEHGQNLTIGELMTNSVHLPEPVEVQPR